MDHEASGISALEDDDRGVPAVEKEPAAAQPPFLRPTIDKAAVPSKCKQEVFQISSNADLKPLEDCKVLIGDLEILDFSDPLILLGAVESIVGSLKIRKSPHLVRVEAHSLASISETFQLRELTSLALISFPSLKSVKRLDWRVLPILSNVNFSNQIESLESIVVSDTSLTGFAGFMTDELEVLDINNNRFLDSIESHVQKVTGNLHIAANARGVVVNLEKLRSSSNMSVHDVSDINLDSLEEISASVSIIDNHFDQLKLPKLKTVSGTLILLDNERVSQLEFPLLTEIGGGLMIVNNTNMEKITFFPKLTSIGGALDLVGNIKEVSFKALKLVKGSARIKSYDAAFDCNKWSKADSSSIIRGGKIECTNARNERLVSDGSPDGDDGSQSRLSISYKSGSSTLVQSLTDIPAFVFLVAVVFLSTR